MRQTRKQRRQKRSYKRLIILGLVLLLAFSAAACRYLNVGIGTAGERTDLMPIHNKINIMIMGVDRRNDDVGRSDTLMVATVDPEQKKASLLSLPRDTRVKIEGNGVDKINAAYAYGGHKLSKTTVEQLLGAPINYYVLVDIKAFERIIDALGGIDINVDKRMYYEDPWDDDGGLVIDLYPGQQHLDGKKAIQYVRYRDGEGDIGRIGRQQKFMQAMLDKIITPSIIAKLPELLREVSSAVETDMSVSEMTKLAAMLQTIKSNGVESSMVPGRPAYVQDVSYWLPDIKLLRQTVAQQLGVPFDDKMQAVAAADAAELEASIMKGTQVLDSQDGTSAEQDKKKLPAHERSEITVLVINSSGIDGAGAKVADTLRQQGFKISSVETGRSSSLPQTRITAAAAEIDKFYGLPFPCIIMTGGESGQATIMIGKDYKVK